MQNFGLTSLWFPQVLVFSATLDASFSLPSLVRTPAAPGYLLACLSFTSHVTDPRVPWVKMWGLPQRTSLFSTILALGPCLPEVPSSTFWHSLAFDSAILFVFSRKASLIQSSSVLSRDGASSRSLIWNIYITTESRHFPNFPTISCLNHW